MSWVKNIAVGAGLSALLGAAPPPQLIAHPIYDSATLVIPHGSPVKFNGFDKETHFARFRGKFVLTGKFTYGCGSNCADYTGPVEESDIHIAVEPDPELAARLPHWKNQQQDILILISRNAGLVPAIANPDQRKALLAGKIQSVKGRIAIIVDQFETGLECDSASFSARFVSMPEAPKLAKVAFKGDYGCGYL